MLLEIATYLVVAVHLAVCFFVSLGTFAVMRWPRLIWIHLPWTAWQLVNAALLHWECPLTHLEKFLRVRADLPVYTGGFVAHYVTGPLGPHDATIFLAFNIACFDGGYAWIVWRAVRSRRSGPPCR